MDDVLEASLGPVTSVAIEINNNVNNVIGEVGLIKTEVTRQTKQHVPLPSEKLRKLSLLLETNGVLVPVPAIQPPPTLMLLFPHHLPRQAELLKNPAAKKNRQIIIGGCDLCTDREVLEVEVGWPCVFLVANVGDSLIVQNDDVATKRRVEEFHSSIRLIRSFRMPKSIFYPCCMPLQSKSATFGILIAHLKKEYISPISKRKLCRADSIGQSCCCSTCCGIRMWFISQTKSKL